MVDPLVAAFVEKGVRVELFNLTVTDIWKLALALVDAATIVVGTSTILAGPHSYAVFYLSPDFLRSHFICTDQRVNMLIKNFSIRSMLVAAIIFCHSDMCFLFI